MPRLSLRAKLLASFTLILLPVLFLLVYGYRQAYEERIETVLDNQMQTAQAVAMLVDASFDEATTFALALAHDPVVHTLDPSQLDAHLESLAPQFPQVDVFGVVNASGDSVGVSKPFPAGTSRRRVVTDRPYFQRVISMGQPVVSEVIVSRASLNPTVVAAVPLRDGDSTIVGVVIVGLDLRALANRLGSIALGHQQEILLVDASGTAAFYTALPDLPWEQRDLRDLAYVRSALEGRPSRARSFVSPLMGDKRIGAFAPSPKYGWVVAVAAPEDVALAPVRNALRDQILGFVAVALLSLGVALIASRTLAQPIRQLTRHALALGKGDLRRRVTIATGDELEELGRGFNRMAEHVLTQQEAIQAQNEELKELDRLKDQFIEIAAHELKTPVAIVKGYAQALLRDSDLASEQGRRMLGAIDRGSSRITNVVQDLLDISKLHAGRLDLEMEQIDLPVTVAETTDRLGLTAPRHHLRVVRADPAVVRGDRDRLEQVLVNLLSNAVKYSPEGGNVDVAVEVRGHEAIVSVRDYGLGIPSEKQSSIFQRFFRAHDRTPSDYGGMGVGLYISKEIVERHGGRMWFESEEAKGSVFYFALPLAGPPPSMNVAE